MRNLGNTEETTQALRHENGTAPFPTTNTRGCHFSVCLPLLPPPVNIHAHEAHEIVKNNT